MPESSAESTECDREDDESCREPRRPTPKGEPLFSAVQPNPQCVVVVDRLLAIHAPARVVVLIEHQRVACSSVVDGNDDLVRRERNDAGVTGAARRIDLAVIAGFTSPLGAEPWNDTLLVRRVDRQSSDAVALNYADVRHHCRKGWCDPVADHVMQGGGYVLLLVEDALDLDRR